MIKSSLEIIIVLYNNALTECKGYISLIENISKINIDYELIIYNNDISHKVERTEGCIVVNSENNDMLAKPYTFALERAKLNDKKWLLLLDQDTELTKEYFNYLELFLSNTQISNQYSAAVPKLIHQKEILSPLWYYHLMGPFLFRSFSFSNKNRNICVTAFNSASLLNVKSLELIGGFSTNYPLDMLDYWCYHKFYENKMKIYFLNTFVEHNLSILDMKNSVSLERFTNYLEAEKKFSKELGIVAAFGHKIKMIIFLITQLRKSELRKFARVTAKALLNISK